jgi:hypothetical protein
LAGIFFICLLYKQWQPDVHAKEDQGIHAKLQRNDVHIIMAPSVHFAAADKADAGNKQIRVIKMNCLFPF